jgi:hypothetical protein
MKKNILLALVAVMAGVGIAMGSARGLSTAALSAQDDGDTRVGIRISCLSSAWTQVVAARPVRRFLKLKSLESATDIICLGTADNGSGTTCALAHAFDLGTGDEYQDANEAVLWCRSGGGTQIIKGFDLYDSRD